MMIDRGICYPENAVPNWENWENYDGSVINSKILAVPNCFFRNQTAAAKTPLLVFLMGTFDHAMARILRWQHMATSTKHQVSCCV
jgi:hypothetical protein